MPDSGPHPTSKFRLAFARHRLRAFIKQIDTVESANFPHADGKEALASIRTYSETLLKKLDIDLESDPDLIDSLCEQTTIAVQRYTRTLGIILRSTNVRNPFELHYHLKKLLLGLVGPEARLLVSSEWEFIPFTFPMNLSLLPSFALIGIPASESDNVLVTPLAGHEIGHSVWLSAPLKSEFESVLLHSIEAVMSSQAPTTENVITALRLGDLGRQAIRQHCLHFGLLQLEEIFCDVLGVGYFGRAYLYAFEYFLAPGGSTRTADYPSVLKRISYLRNAAEQVGVTYDGNTFERWQDSAENQNLNKDLVAILDASVDLVASQVITRGLDLLSSAGVAIPDTNVTDRVLASFRRREPDGGGATLPEVVTAGWDYVRQQEGLSAESERDEFRTLTDLMLKSVEVSEFLERTADNA